MPEATLDDIQAPAPAQGGVASVDDIAEPAHQAPVKSDDRGIVSGVTRAAKNIAALPGQLWDAITKEPQNAEEKNISEMGVQSPQGHIPGAAALPIYRLMIAPMEAAQARGDHYAKLAETETNPDIKKQLLDAAGTYRGVGAHVPFLGPMAASMAERGAYGPEGAAAAGQGGTTGWANKNSDLAGSTAEGTAYALAPKVTEGIAKAGGAGLQGAAEYGYGRALKPSTARLAPNPEGLVKTGLENAVGVSPGGMAKLGDLIDDVNQKISDEIAARPNQPINKYAVATRLNPLATRASKQVNPEADVASVIDSSNEFLRNQPENIPSSEAQQIKQNTYRELGNKSYGEIKSSSIEAQKALARGIKEELANAFPELNELNAKDGELIKLQSAIENTVRRGSNKPFIGTGTTVAAGTGALMSGPKTALAIAAMKAIVDNPMVKSQLAIALNKASKGMKAVSINSRIGTYSAALGASSEESGDQ